MSEDVDAVDALFTLARAERTTSTLSVDAALESARATLAGARRASACTIECRACVAYTLRVYRTSANALHVCVEGACRERTAHATNTRVPLADVVPAWRDADAVVYYCAEHARVHACGVGACALVTTLADGYTACVYSNRVVAAPLEAAYTEATSVVDTQLGAVQRSVVEERRRATVAARPAALAVHALLTTPSDGDDGHDDDVDFPSTSLFPTAGAANTFGDGVDLTLLRCYSGAHASTHVLLMSAARAELVAKQRVDAYKRSVRVGRAYVERARAKGARIYQYKLAELVTSELHRQRAYPTLVLAAERDARRLVAYYAMQCVDLYMNIVRVARTTSLVATKRQRRNIAPIFTTDLVNIVPSLLMLIETGLQLSNGVVIVHREPLLAGIMPTEHTMQALGFPKRTTIGRCLRTLFAAVAESPRELAQSMRATHIDTAELLTAPPGESIVRLFLERRRARIGERR